MKVKCIANSGKNLFKEDSAHINSHNYVGEYLKIGETYIVYGINFYKRRLEYLIAAETQRGNATFWEPK